MNVDSEILIMIYATLLIKPENIRMANISYREI